MITTPAPSNFLLTCYLLCSLIADKFVFPEDTILDTAVGEHPDTLTMIVIVFEHSDIILTAWEENSSIAVQFVIFV